LLPGAQTEELLKKVRNCPVHKTQISLWPPQLLECKEGKDSKGNAALMLTTYPWLTWPSDHIHH
jgi:hypothetical protein